MREEQLDTDLALCVAEVAAEEAGRCLIGASVESVTLRDGILDLELRFDTGHILQMLPDSSGYEAWNASHRGKQFIAVGGGHVHRCLRRS